MNGERASIERTVGKLYSELWTPYDQRLFDESVQLFLKRLRLARFDPE